MKTPFTPLSPPSDRMIKREARPCFRLLTGLLLLLAGFPATLYGEALSKRIPPPGKAPVAIRKEQQNRKAPSYPRGELVICQHFLNSPLAGLIDNRGPYWLRKDRCPSIE